MGMVVNCAAYQAGCRVADIDLSQAAGIDTSKGGFVWIGLHEPDEELLRNVQRRFGLHDLAIEDAHAAHQRPKLEVYGDSLSPQNAHWLLSKILSYLTHLHAVGRVQLIPGEPERWSA